MTVCVLRGFRVIVCSFFACIFYVFCVFSGVCFAWFSCNCVLIFLCIFYVFCVYFFSRPPLFFMNILPFVVVVVDGNIVFV